MIQVMDKFMFVVVIAVVIFLLTYDPKSGTIERYLHVYDPDKKKKQCQDEEFRGKYPEQCKEANYNAIQFASSTFMNPMPTNSKMGAIIRP
jgi:hypothetical protein